MKHGMIAFLLAVCCFSVGFAAGPGATQIPDKALYPQHYRPLPTPYADLHPTRIPSQSDALTSTQVPHFKNLHDVYDYVMYETSPTEHGGAYWGGNQAILHVNLVSGSSLYDILPDWDTLILHDVKFSYTSLCVLKEKLKGIKHGLNILMVDSIENHLIVGVDSLTEEVQDAIYAIAPDPDMVQILEGQITH